MYKLHSTEKNFLTAHAVPQAPNAKPHPFAALSALCFNSAPADSTFSLAASTRDLRRWDFSFREDQRRFARMFAEPIKKPFRKGRRAQSDSCCWGKGKGLVFGEREGGSVGWRRNDLLLRGRLRGSLFFGECGVRMVLGGSGRV